jgi:hypothetical protein
MKDYDKVKIVIKRRSQDKVELSRSQGSDDLETPGEHH